MLVDGFADSLCKEVSEACKRNCRAAAGEFNDRVVNPYRAEDDPGDHIAYQDPGGGELRQVYQELTDRAECPSDEKRPDVFKKHIKFISLTSFFR